MYHSRKRQKETGKKEVNEFIGYITSKKKHENTML
jgi:hypothetical protein